MDMHSEFLPFGMSFAIDCVPNRRSQDQCINFHYILGRSFSSSSDTTILKWGNRETIQSIFRGIFNQIRGENRLRNNKVLFCPKFINVVVTMCPSFLSIYFSLNLLVLCYFSCMLLCVLSYIIAK